MQELIDQLNELSNHYYTLSEYDTSHGICMAVEHIMTKLEKEKEQIKDAWDAGMSEGIGTMMADLDWDGEFVNYYKETYGEQRINIRTS